MKITDLRSHITLKSEDLESAVFNLFRKKKTGAMGEEKKQCDWTRATIRVLICYLGNLGISTNKFARVWIYLGQQHHISLILLA